MNKKSQMITINKAQYENILKRLDKVENTLTENSLKYRDVSLKEENDIKKIYKNKINPKKYNSSDYLKL